MEKNEIMTADYQTLLEMWRTEKKKRQEAEGELTIIKGIGNNSPEMKALQKRVTEVEEDNKKLAKQIEDLSIPRKYGM
tara:strand:- start:247 stop:480 length:234 start_codon:yes stop_codon:yes gene_type:complete